MMTGIFAAIVMSALIAFPASSQTAVHDSSCLTIKAAGERAKCQLWACFKKAAPLYDDNATPANEIGKAIANTECGEWAQELSDDIETKFKLRPHEARRMAYDMASNWATAAVLASRVNAKAPR